MTTDDLPRYRSHKVVRAAKIYRVHEPGHTLTLVVDGEGQFDIKVPENFFSRGWPAPGDWYVLYPDGYQSWSPAAQFVDGYTRVSL